MVSSRVEGRSDVRKHWSIQFLQAMLLRFLFLQHFANFWHFLFVDVEFDVVYGDWFLVFNHMVFMLIEEVVVNQLDNPGGVIALPEHIAFGFLYF